jgi:hypothetical protein
MQFYRSNKVVYGQLCLSHFLNLFGGTPRETKKHTNLDLGVIFLNDCLTISYFINKLTMNYHYWVVIMLRDITLVKDNSSFSLFVRAELICCTLHYYIIILY